MANRLGQCFSAEVRKMQH